MSEWWLAYDCGGCGSSGDSSLRSQCTGGGGGSNSNSMCWRLLIKIIPLVMNMFVVGSSIYIQALNIKFEYTIQMKNYDGLMAHTPFLRSCHLCGNEVSGSGSYLLKGGAGGC